ncbi:hypothetical protein [Clostridium butyricum]
MSRHKCKYDGEMLIFYNDKYICPCCFAEYKEYNTKPKGYITDEDGFVWAITDTKLIEV